jgi:hypothetical protein
MFLVRFKGGIVQGEREASADGDAAMPNCQ